MIEELSAALLSGQGDALGEGRAQTDLVARVYAAHTRREAAKSDYTWPVISDRVYERVAAQLGKTTSIYNRSGVFERFEDRWAAVTAKRMRCSPTRNERHP